MGAALLKDEGTKRQVIIGLAASSAVGIAVCLLNQKPSPEAPVVKNGAPEKTATESKQASPAAAQRASTPPPVKSKLRAEAAEFVPQGASPGRTIISVAAATAEPTRSANGNVLSTAPPPPPPPAPPTPPKDTYRMYSPSQIPKMSSAVKRSSSGDVGLKSAACDEKGNVGTSTTKAAASTSNLSGTIYCDLDG